MADDKICQVLGKRSDLQECQGYQLFISSCHTQMTQIIFLSALDDLFVSDMGKLSFFVSSVAREWQRSLELEVTDPCGLLGTF